MDRPISSDAHIGGIVEHIDDQHPPFQEGLRIPTSIEGAGWTARIVHLEFEELAFGERCYSEWEFLVPGRMVDRGVQIRPGDAIVFSVKHDALRLDVEHVFEDRLCPN